MLPTSIENQCFQNSWPLNLCIIKTMHQWVQHGGRSEGCITAKWVVWFRIFTSWYSWITTYYLWHHREFSGSRKWRGNVLNLLLVFEKPPNISLLFACPLFRMTFGRTFPKRFKALVMMFNRVTDFTSGVWHVQDIEIFVERCFVSLWLRWHCFMLLLRWCINVTVRFVEFRSWKIVEIRFQC